MFDIGFLELVIVAIIGLLVLGPERLPKAARTAGRWVGKARRMVSSFSREIERQMEAEELREKLKQSGESLNLDEDVKNIQQTLKSALEEARIDPVDSPPANDRPRANTGNDTSV